MPADDRPACGTEAAYRTHLAAGEDCETCREAHNERARGDDKKRARSRAQSRALKALARCFPIEYNALYQQELAKETTDVE
ncbi:hypothetical protein NE236_41500 [Actinoallomurus purpureus]|uniref:hypothetical protein n=1 Tax=Actinoallomurus purpureus TaxID=478114 RepID=UPI002093E7EA|nr:hypothetical protein [Actinoallomurus purpureus]MCO6011445.1 hypothetical protein [Actinoallomurus purpureus]